MFLIFLGFFKTRFAVLHEWFQINIFQQIILLIFVSVSVGAITNIAVCYVMSPSSSLIEFGQKKKTKLVSSFPCEDDARDL